MPGDFDAVNAHREPFSVSDLLQVEANSNGDATDDPTPPHVASYINEMVAPLAQLAAQYRLKTLACLLALAKEQASDDSR